MKKRTVVMGYLLVLVLSVAADQLLKAWTVATIPLNAAPEAQIPLIPGIVHLTYIRNTGAAFGMMQGWRWGFLVLLAAFCAVVVWALATNKLVQPLQRWLAVLAVGGAVGNGIDRWLYGYVVDMFELEFMNFAIFNLADIIICVSCFLFILSVLLEGKDKTGKPNATAEE